MLKITTERLNGIVALKLEGKLAGAWVQELERSWAAVSGQGRVALDLSSVTYVDAEGRKLLASIHRQGGQLQASGCMTRCLVEEIERTP